MPKKNKKILISAIILILIIAITAFVLIHHLNSKPSDSNVTTIHQLFEKNREHFSSLSSIDTSVKVYCEYNIVESNETAVINLTTTTKKNYLQNSATMQSTQETTSNGTTSTETETIYIINENGADTIYSQKTFNTVNKGWRINDISQQLKQIAQAEDFYFIDSYESVLELTRESVEINGVKYYEVTGTINDIKKIANHYDVSKWLGFYREDIESYAVVTLYFREDNNILHSIKYDFTNYWKDEFSALEPNQDRTLTGELSVEIVFNDFDTVNEIVVDAQIKENAVPPLKNPIKEPIDLDNQLYLLEVEDCTFKIGTKLSQYVNLLNLEPLVDISVAKYNEEGLLLIDSGETFLCSATISENETLILGGVNNTPNAVAYTDCLLNKVNIYKDSDAFTKFVLGKKLTHKNTVKEFRDVLGFYNMYEQSNDLAFISWRSYTDYTDIELEVDLTTGAIIDISVFCFNVDKYLNNMDN